MMTTIEMNKLTSSDFFPKVLELRKDKGNFDSEIIFNLIMLSNSAEDAKKVFDHYVSVGKIKK